MTALPIVVMSEEEVAGFGRRDDLGFGALRTERGLLPLAAMDVDARITGVMASIEIAQTFVNTTGTPIEATYVFPLPDRAAVNRFRMEVAGRVVEGVVQERGWAREQYEEAISQGHRASIAEEERAGVFTLRVGNLMPGESATVRLSLVGPLAVDDGEVTFQFPLVVAPRYMPGYNLGGDQAGLGAAADTSLVPDASRISPPRLLRGCPNPVRLGIRVALADHGVRDVMSSLHLVTTSLRDAHVVELGDAERLDRDFILRWRIDGSELRSSLVCCDDADGKAGTFMLTMVPPSTQSVAQKPRDVVFVIDRSGSMDGWKMLAARRATARMIDTLTSRDRFLVIAFDNVVETLPGSRMSMPFATDRNRYQVVEELSAVKARGGTELALPLQLAVRTLAGGHDDRERVIVLVTDGQVGNEDQILRDIAPALRNVRVFTLGIDQAVNASFLKRFASAGGGLCELVESEDRLDDVMAKVHRRVGTPIATELRLDANGMSLQWASISPTRLPDVYAGSPVTVFGRYTGRAPANATIGIEGTAYGDPFRVQIAREGGETTATPAIASSWARAHIRDLEDKYALGAHDLEHEIVRVSRQFSVLSRFTAYLAVDRSQVVNRGGGLVQMVQAVEEPAGWNGAVPASPMGGGSPRSAPARSAGPMPPPGAARSVSSMPSQRSPVARPGGVMPPPMAAPMPSPPPPPMDSRDDSDDDFAEALRSAPRPPRPTEAAPMPMVPYAPAPSMPAGSSSQSPGPRSIAPRPAPSGGPSSNAPRRPASAASSPPPPAYSPSSSPPPAYQRHDRDDRARGEVAADAGVYLVNLAQLARELEAQAHGSLGMGALRLLRERLRQWVEDLRSVGGHDELAHAVADQVQRLGAALSSPSFTDEVRAIAAVLAGIAGGAPLPPKKSGRVAFWK
jgi:Ca-activated chloride channel family protein